MCIRDRLEIISEMQSVWTHWDSICIHNSPLKGIGVRDFYAFFDFFLLAGRFLVGCGSKFREILAYLEVGRLDLEPIHEKNNFSSNLGYIFMGILGYIHGHSRIYSWVFSDIFIGKL